MAGRSSISFLRLSVAVASAASAAGLGLFTLILVFFSFCDCIPRLSPTNDDDGFWTTLMDAYRTTPRIHFANVFESADN